MLTAVLFIIDPRLEELRWPSTGEEKQTVVNPLTRILRSNKQDPTADPCSPLEALGQAIPFT